MGFKGGGGQIDPQHILVFKYPSRDRVNVSHFEPNIDLNNNFMIFNCNNLNNK